MLAMESARSMNRFSQGSLQYGRSRRRCRSPSGGGCTHRAHRRSRVRVRSRLRETAPREPNGSRRPIGPLHVVGHRNGGAVALAHHRDFTDRVVDVAAGRASVGATERRSRRYREQKRDESRHETSSVDGPQHRASHRPPPESPGNMLASSQNCTNHAPVTRIIVHFCNIPFRDPERRLPALRPMRGHYRPRPPRPCRPHTPPPPQATAP